MPASPACIVTLRLTGHRGPKGNQGRSRASVPFVLLFLLSFHSPPGAPGKCRDERDLVQRAGNPGEAFFLPSHFSPFFRPRSSRGPVPGPRPHRQGYPLPASFFPPFPPRAPPFWQRKFSPIPGPLGRSRRKHVSSFRAPLFQCPPQLRPQQEIGFFSPSQLSRFYVNRPLSDISLSSSARPTFDGSCRLLI